MRTLGLLGGMSWESTAITYRHLNEIARGRLGGLHSARVILWSFDFEEVARLQHRGDWAGAAALLANAARRLEDAGADAIMLCTNTMHEVAEELEAAISIPLIHIINTTAFALKKAGSRRPILLATRFTMEREFYRSRLRERHGIDALIPDADGREIIHRVIYEELCRGLVLPQSRAAYLSEIERLRAAEADGLILGCTEITMLIGQKDVDLPVFDTTRLHAEVAMDFALGATEHLPEGRTATKLVHAVGGRG